MTKAIVLTHDSWAISHDAVPEGECRSIVSERSYAAISGRGDFINTLATKTLRLLEAIEPDEVLRGEVTLFAPYEDIEMTLLPVVRSFAASQDELLDPNSDVMVRAVDAGRSLVNTPKIYASIEATLDASRACGEPVEFDDIIDPMAASALYQGHRDESLVVLSHLVFAELAASGGWMTRDDEFDDDWPDGVASVVYDLWDHVVVGKPLVRHDLDIETWRLVMDFFVGVHDELVAA